MQALFVKIDGPLNIDHCILEVWDGATTTYVRGEAEMAKKDNPFTAIKACHTVTDVGDRSLASLIILSDRSILTPSDLPF
jgi:hypothetical protein